MSDQTTLEVVLSSESTVGNPIIETVTVLGTVAIGPRGIDGSSGGAPDDAGYLVTAAHADLSAEVVVGATPGGELGGTWASPTVDAIHSGSTHAAVQAAAEATAAADATAKVAAEAALARNADNLSSGTVADARIASTIARDSEVAAAYQPLDADLTALAAANNSAVLAATTASFLTADETKLDGIEAGAQVNPSSEVLQDLVGAMVSGGTETGIAVTYDDTNARLDFVAEVTQAELDLKAPLASPTFTGNVVVPDADADTEAMNRQTSDARYAAIAYSSFVRLVRQTLTDKTSFAGTGDEQWGTEEATLDDALLPKLTSVTVRAACRGQFVGTTDAAFLVTKMQISLDGGSTWDTGLTEEHRKGLNPSGNDRWAVTPTHQVTGTITGDIQARVMVSCSLGSSTTYDLTKGAIYMDVEVHP